MKRLYAVVGIILLSAACGSTESKPANSSQNITPNGDPNANVSQCVFDADCDAGEACEQERCVATCASDADCAAGEVCAPGLNTDLQVCQVDEGPTNIVDPNIEPNIEPNVEPNISTQTLYYAARIQSQSVGDDACFNVTDPGPDIYAVGLEDTVGSPLGWGRHISNLVQFDGNDHVDTSVLDGSAPGLDADSCPDQFDGNVVALGCDAESWLAVEFIDGDGFPVPMVGDGSQQIVVYEYGAQCGGTVVDEFRVDICTDIEGVREGDDSSCNINILQGGSAISIGEVSGF